MRWALLSILYTSSISYKFCRLSLIQSPLVKPFLRFISTVTTSFSSSSTIMTSFSDPVISNYNKLIDHVKDIERLSGVKALVQWDSLVMMKEGSYPARNEQTAALTAVIYEKQTNEELGKLINDLSNADLSSLISCYEQANVRDAKRDYDLTTRKTKDMAVRETELEGRGYQTWVKAREENKFSDFAPVLKEIVELKKEIVKVTHPDQTSYDGNIDSFERGMKTARLQEIFSNAKARIIPLYQHISKVKELKPYTIPESFQGGDLWDVEKQKTMCAEIAEAIGFDFKKGRLDISVHPFTGGSHPTDIRITTRYSTSNWLEGIGGTVHEVGHALYEQGRNPKYYDTPVSRALSMGVHESQSLFWERMIFQSREFWEWATPIFHKYFPHTSNQSVEDFYMFVNQVEAGFIRIEADEVTYPLHIILRFEIEQGLFDNSISVDDLPSIWNKKIFDSLGLVVPSDSKGVLQDVHWSGGAFGYFPSYSLGAMISAQLFETAVKEIPSLRQKISKGEFKELREWLRVKVHEVGSLYASPDELLIAITEKPLDPGIFSSYLEEKYGNLYELK